MNFSWTAAEIRPGATEAVPRGRGGVMNRMMNLAGAALLVSALAAGVLYGVSARAPANAQTAFPLLDFPDGTATASETCGACRQGIYQDARQP